jgi:glutamine synthetase
VKASGVGDAVFMGPEAEFFIFDNVKFGTGGNYGIYQLDSIEGPGASLKDYPEGNMGHRPVVKGGYFPVPPVDSESDLRAEMLSTMGEMGLTIEKHHHEVAQSQHELGMKFGPLVRMADQLQIYKYVIHNVAHSYGKSATFMPKPIYGDNGSGMHVHQSIWRGGKPLFAGNGYADLSETALYYIGGIIKHAKALNAFTNPSTNSYKRLIPGFEAPVLLAYSARNRSASCRIPYATSPKAKRVEVRFPDPTANPYLAFAAMMMAGLDGIQNKVEPPEALNVDIYELSAEEKSHIKSTPGSLGEALTALEEDQEFLLKGGVFTKDLLESFIDIKRSKDIVNIALRPHPYEFFMYYDA